MPSPSPSPHPAHPGVGSPSTLESHSDAHHKDKDQPTSASTAAKAAKSEESVQRRASKLPETYVWEASAKGVRLTDPQCDVLRRRLAECRRSIAVLEKSIEDETARVHTALPDGEAKDEARRNLDKDWWPLRQIIEKNKSEILRIRGQLEWERRQRVWEQPWHERVRVWFTKLCFCDWNEESLEEV